MSDLLPISHPKEGVVGRLAVHSEVRLKSLRVNSSCSQPSRLPCLPKLILSIFNPFIPFTHTTWEGTHCHLGFSKRYWMNYLSCNCPAAHQAVSLLGTGDCVSFVLVSPGPSMVPDSWLINTCLLNFWGNEWVLHTYVIIVKKLSPYLTHMRDVILHTN